MSRKKKVFIVLWGCILLLNVIAWCSHSFCDSYVTFVFPWWINTYGRITGLFPVSIGEWMLYLAALLVAAALVLWIPWVLVRKRKSSHFFRGYYRFMAWFLTVVCMIMTLNCILLYHCSTITVVPAAEELQIGQAQPDGIQTGWSQTDELLESLGITDLENQEVCELVAVRELVVRNCNRLAVQMQRDADGFIVYEGDLAQEAITSVRRLKSSYPRLGGYYPEPKPLACSWFFCQQYMCGYYFPFSMEANYNDMMYIMNIPYTMCHELTHLKGDIYEDEANFLAYLACIHSTDPVFEYSGYLGVLYYVENDLYDAFESIGRTDLYQRMTAIDGQVVSDDIFLTKEAWDEVEETSALSTEFVSEVTDQFLETNLTINGVADGVISYSRVVELMMDYYK